MIVIDKTEPKPSCRFPKIRTQPKTNAFGFSVFDFEWVGFWLKPKPNFKFISRYERRTKPLPTGTIPDFPNIEFDRKSISIEYCTELTLCVPVPIMVPVFGTNTCIGGYRILNSVMKCSFPR